MQIQKIERHIVLVHPEIPWNTGCVGRTCLGTGSILHLVEPLGFSLSSKEVKRAGLDYWPRVDVRVWKNFSDFINAMEPEEHEMLFFTKTARRSFREIKPILRMFLIFGSESGGLPDDLLKNFSGQSYYLPISREIRSLNLATAVGIALFESLRGLESIHGW